MPESGSSGSVRGALRNERPYRERDSHPDCRAAAACLYLTVVDAHGDEVTLSRSGEWSIFPYECAADRIDAH